MSRKGEWTCTDMANVGVGRGGVRATGGRKWMDLRGVVGVLEEQGESGAGPVEAEAEARDAMEGEGVRREKARRCDLAKGVI